MLRARRPAPKLRRPIWWSLAGRPAKRTRKKRYYAVLESTARSPGGSSALTHHLEPPQTLTAVLMIIGLLARWHASNAHLPQSTPLVTAAPIAFLPRADLLCSHAGFIAPLCRRLQLFSAQPSERHTLHNPQHFACFGLGSTIQKSTRGCSRQTVVAVYLYGAFATVFTPTNSISEHAYTPLLQNGCCRSGNITSKG